MTVLRVYDHLKVHRHTHPYTSGNAATDAEAYAHIVLVCSTHWRQATNSVSVFRPFRCVRSAVQARTCFNWDFLLNCLHIHTICRNILFSFVRFRFRFCCRCRFSLAIFYSGFSLPSVNLKSFNLLCVREFCDHFNFLNFRTVPRAIATSP